MSGRKILVTGGAGFIGSAVVRQAIAAGHEVVNLDALTYAGNLDNLSDLDEARHRFIKGDICDREAVMAAVPEGCDAIFNFAAESHVDRSIASADEFLRTNIIGTQVLLDAARAKDFDLLASYHLHHPKFSKFDDFEPLDRQDAAAAQQSEEEAFGAISNLQYRIEGLKVDVFGPVAISAEPVARLQASTFS